MTTAVALITGATAGIGAQFARQLAASGCHLLLVARSAQALTEFGTELRAEFKVEVFNVAVDLSHAGATAEIVAFCERHKLRVDWLINNAGSAGPDLIREPSDDRQNAFFQLMMLSVAQLCRAFIPSMLAQGYGRVVNVASVAGRLPSKGGCNYGPSKAYVIALSEDLALTYAGEGVHVTALCPGFTHTEFHSRAGLHGMKAKLPAWLWYDSATVVLDAITAVERGQAVVTSGRLYRWLDPVIRSSLLRWWLYRFNR